MPISADIPNHNRAETAIVRAVNVQRRRHGVRSLRARRGLARVASRHSAAMLRHDSLQHASFDGTSITARIRRGGRYSDVGEVLAWVPRGADRRARAIVGLWMASPGHRNQLLDPRFRRIGVGRRRGGLGAERGWIFTVNFGG